MAFTAQSHVRWGPLGLGVLLILSACGERGRSATAVKWDTFVDEYLEATFAAFPSFAVNAGRHEYDGQLPDFSLGALRAEVERQKAARSRALAFDPEALDDRRRLEREHLIAEVDGSLFWLEDADWPRRNPTFYGFALRPDVYVTREYAPLAERMAAYVRHAREIPRAAAQIRENLRTPLPRTYVQVGRLTFGGLASFFEDDVPEIFASVEDAGLQADFREANAGAISAMRELDAWLAAQEAQATDDFALGAERFSRMLWATERVDVPLEELERLGRADLERNLAALRDACGKYAPGASIPDCIAKAQARKPSEGPVAAAERQLGDLKAFLREADLVTIPGTEEVRVAESPPYARWNFAYIDIPGPYEKELPSVYYIAPPNPSWSPEEQTAYIPGEADLLFVSVHEVWPGHFLQFLHSNRSASPFGRLFVGYAFAEGWAHYAEELMWEVGLGAGDPEVQIGMLLNALLRNVRFLSALGLHTGTMTVEESERMFREQAFQDPGNARQQAARGTFDPAYLNYTMGKMMIRRLREDWTAERGGRSAWRDFHDAFLSFGGAPIPVIRAAMLGPDGGPSF